jgi:ribosome-associated protein
MTLDSEVSLKKYIQAVLGKKAEYLVILDVAELSSIADYFIICSGRSSRQVKAIADHVLLELKKQGLRPLSVEGEKEGHWVVLDFGDVVIHLFYEPVRSFYDLESLWADAPRISTPDMLADENAFPDANVDGNTWE